VAWVEDRARLHCGVPVTLGQKSAQRLLCRSELPRPQRGGLRWEEEKMTGIVARLVADNRGQDLAEYGIALAVIATLAAAAAVVIALDVGTLWSRAQNLIDSAAS